MKNKKLILITSICLKSVFAQNGEHAVFFKGSKIQNAIHVSQGKSSVFLSDEKKSKRKTFFSIQFDNGTLLIPDQNNKQEVCELEPFEVFYSKDNFEYGLAQENIKKVTCKNEPQITLKPWVDFQKIIKNYVKDNRYWAKENKQTLLSFTVEKGKSILGVTQNVVLEEKIQTVSLSEEYFYNMDNN